MALVQKIAFGYIRTKFKLLSSISKKKAAQQAFDLFCTPPGRNQNPLPQIFEASEKLQFNFDGIPIQGYRWNHPREKKVLILHGFESSVINFDAYVQPLLNKGYEVLAFDAPGHGRSGGKKITAVIYKNFIKEIVDRFGPVQSFIAHSFGGLAVALALEEIEHDANHRLVFIAPATETTSAVDAFFKFLQLDASLKPEFEQVIFEVENKPADWYSVKRAVNNIKARILWLHDEKDPITPIHDVRKVKEQNHSHIEFVFTKGLGHSQIYRDVKVINRIVAFL